MLIRGRWLLCDDGIIRPVIEATALAANGFLHAGKVQPDLSQEQDSPPLIRAYSPGIDSRPLSVFLPIFP